MGCALLYGFPGCGKSYITEAIAKEIGLPMVKLSPADLFRGIVGESESRVKQLTRLIESLSPIIVDIEEIDQIALARGEVAMTDSGVNRRITNMLLDWLGQRDRNSFVIGSTNFLKHMDPAFVRAGRIDEVILVLPPDKAAREQILDIHCKMRKLPMDPMGVSFNKLADDTWMWTGAELQKLVISSAYKALEAEAKYVTLEHFEEAMSEIEVNKPEREKSIHSMVNDMMKTEASISRTFLNKEMEAFTKGEGKEDRTSSFVDSLRE